jgi:hypothetical protein
MRGAKTPLTNNNLHRKTLLNFLWRRYRIYPTWYLARENFRNLSCSVFTDTRPFGNSQHKFNNILANDCPQKKKKNEIPLSPLLREALYKIILVIFSNEIRGLFRGKCAAFSSLVMIGLSRYSFYTRHRTNFSQKRNACEQNSVSSSLRICSVPTWDFISELLSNNREF